MPLQKTDVIIFVNQVQPCREALVRDLTIYLLSLLFKSTLGEDFGVHGEITGVSDIPGTKTTFYKKTI